MQRLLILLCGLIELPKKIICFLYAKYIKLENLLLSMPIAAGKILRSALTKSSLASCPEAVLQIGFCYNINVILTVVCYSIANTELLHT